MPRRRTLSPQEERFTILYVAGTDDLRGNATRCYLEAYPNTTNPKIAGSAGSRLLKRERVRARMRELRDEAERDAKARLRSWMGDAPRAQDTLLQAMEGDWPEGWTDEQIRSAVKAATHWLDRALGSVKQMHDIEHHGPGVLVFVAGPGNENGREIEAAASIERLSPSRSAALLSR